MTIRKISIVFSMVLSVLLSTSVYAHGGRTDSSGCHTNRKTGDHHCHGGGSSSGSSRQSSARMQCTDFDSQEEAQEYFERTNDRRLDRDRDGYACETHFGGQANNDSSNESTTDSMGIATLPSSRDIHGKVVGISDGDTLTILDSSNRQHKIRLNAIDAPELGQPFGQASKKALSDICYSKQASAVYVDTDKYGRTVADVTCGRYDTALHMLTRGYAWVFDQYASNYQHLYTYQDTAKSARKGLWADEQPIAPWDWRHPERATQPSVSTPNDSDEHDDGVAEKVLGNILDGLLKVLPKRRY
jgi:endonuclease YncB( thermonuclease family)